MSLLKNWLSDCLVLREISLLRNWLSYCLVLLVPCAALAQEYPSRSMTLVVPFAAGSATDLLARTLGMAISNRTKQPVVIDNKPGASGLIAGQFVARAAPDGYTVLIGGNTTHAANQHLYKKLPYDPLNDFIPVTSTGRGAQIMLVRPDSPAKSVEQFIALAKTRTLSFASGSSSSRIGSELFQQMAGISMLHVPYRSTPQGIADLLAGQVDMMVTDSVTGIAQVRSGKLFALAVTSKERSPLLPDVMSIHEAGVTGYELTYWSGAWVPAKTPPEVVNTLNRLIVEAAHDPSSEAYYKGSATDIFTMTPAQFLAFQIAEAERWGRVIRAAGIEAE
ncbi:MAG: tripartite tricarboxylate transporter substrate binding protein [Alcaligenaceae bacterium]